MIKTDKVLLVEILYFLIFIFLLRYLKVFQIKGVSNWIIPIGFTVKVLVGVVFLFIYLHPDTNNSVPSDTMRFMRESEILHNIFYQSPKDYFTLLFGITENNVLVHKYLSETFLWDAGSYTLVNDSRNLIRFNSLIHFISFGSAFIHNLFMCFIGIIGVKQIYISFEKYTQLNKTIFFFLILSVPSLIFWTSGILKEPILFFGIALFTRTILLKAILKKRILLGIISLIILLSFKPYNLICTIPPLLFGFYNLTVFKTSIIKSVIAVIVTISLGILLLPNQREKTVKYLSRKQFDFDHVGKGGIFTDYNDTAHLYFQMKDYDKIDVNMKDSSLQIINKTAVQIVSKRHDFKTIDSYKDASKTKFKVVYNVGGALSYIKTSPINNSFFQLIKNIPEALINSLLRPFPNDPGSALKFVALFELWFIFIILLVSLKLARNLNSVEKRLITALIIFIISLSLVIGFTTPVLGAIFRYRFLNLLAIVIISAVIINPKKLNILR